MSIRSPSTVLSTADLRSVLRFLFRDPLTSLYTLFLMSVLALGAVGPELARYGYTEIIYRPAGGVLRTASPSLAHPLGTTSDGYDVLSRILYGARPTVITGLLGGSIIISIGGTVGVISGYYGGHVDNALMRLTDFMFGIPLIPFAIVLLALFPLGFYSAILVIGIVLWRGSARIIRSEVLQVRERSHVQSAKAKGGSDVYVIRAHVVPNVLPVIVLLFSLSIGYAILVQAGLVFVGVVEPFFPSWGAMLRNAYQSGFMDVAWWWSAPPGVLISLTVFSTFMLGRRLNDSDESKALIG